MVNIFDDALEVKMGRLLETEGLKGMRKTWLMGACLSATLLSGCALAPVVVGGTALTTATVMTDRRTAGTILNDEVLEKRVSYDITQALPHRDLHVTVTAYEGKVLLTGEVPTTADKQRVESTARAVQSVTSVVNELAVAENASVSARLSDSLLATKVRSRILATEKISLNQMKVTVDRGIVYLMGVVSGQEAKTASNVVASVSGVRKVVTVFTVLSDAEIAQRMKDLKAVSDSEAERNLSQ